MTPEEKAKELYKEAYEFVHKGDSTIGPNKLAKMQAKIICDRIIEGIERSFDEYEKANNIYIKNRIFYWDFYSDVKLELHKL
jgi:ribonuclease HII